MFGSQPDCRVSISIKVVLEFVAFLIITVFYLFRILGYPERKRTLIRLTLIATASWCAEETCILSYGFYSYCTNWRLSLLDVPILIMLVWPAVIQSAWDLASQIAARKVKLVPIIAAGIVWTDAFLIEPVAVNAGLWHWNRPGIYHVPLIGLFGWAYFAYLCVLVFDLKDRKVVSSAFNRVSVVLPVLGSHLMLLCTWWALFKWIDTPLNTIFVAGIAWGLSICLSGAIFRSNLAFRIEKTTLLSRIPAAMFIFGLLAVPADTDRYLVIYAVAFVLPYLTLMVKQYK